MPKLGVLYKIAKQLNDILDELGNNIAADPSSPPEIEAAGEEAFDAIRAAGLALDDRIISIIKDKIAQVEQSVRDEDVFSEIAKADAGFERFEEYRMPRR